MNKEEVFDLFDKVSICSEQIKVKAEEISRVIHSSSWEKEFFLGIEIDFESRTIFARFRYRGDVEDYPIPLDYLFDDDFETKHKIELQKAKEKKEEEKRLREKIESKQKEEMERKTLAFLKKKYEV